MLNLTHCTPCALSPRFIAKEPRCKSSSGPSAVTVAPKFRGIYEVNGIQNRKTQHHLLIVCPLFMSMMSERAKKESDQGVNQPRDNSTREREATGDEKVFCLLFNG